MQPILAKTAVELMPLGQHLDMPLVVSFWYCSSGTTAGLCRLASCDKEFIREVFRSGEPIASGEWQVIEPQYQNHPDKAVVERICHFPLGQHPGQAAGMPGLKFCVW